MLEITYLLVKMSHKSYVTFIIYFDLILRLIFRCDYGPYIVKAVTVVGSSVRRQRLAAKHTIYGVLVPGTSSGRRCACSVLVDVYECRYATLQH